MQTIKLLLLSVLMTISIKSYSQTIKWSYTYGGSRDESGNSITQLTDGKFMVVGSTRSSNGAVSNYYGGGDIWMFKMDRNGALIWDESWGGTGEDIAHDVQATKDGGFVVAGTTNSVDVDVDHRHVKWDIDNNGDTIGVLTNNEFWIIKLDSGGKWQWDTALGGFGEEIAYSVKQTADGGYIVVGSTTSANDGDVTGVHGVTDPSYKTKPKDFWIVKLSPKGSIEWSKAFGGSNDDVARDVVQTPDGGYVITGNTLSRDGDVTAAANHSDTFYNDFWIIKISNNGNLLWNRRIGGENTDEVKAITLSKDGNSVVVAGNAYVTMPSGTEPGIRVVAFDTTGKTLWNNFYGGDYFDGAEDIFTSNDGGYLIAGQTNASFFTGDRFTPELGLRDGWLLKINENGQTEWDKTLGGTDGDDVLNAVIQANNGEIFTVGNTDSEDADPAGSYGGTDIFVVKLPDVKTYQKNVTICEGSTYKFNHAYIGYDVSIYTLSEDLELTGRYYQIHNKGDYDSTIVLNFQVQKYKRDFRSVFICPGEKILLQGAFRNTTGTYTDTFKYTGGCDSLLLTTSLTVFNLDLSVSQSTGKLIANASDAESYKWINCETQQVISGANSKEFLPSEKGLYAVIITSEFQNGDDKYTCSDTSECIQFNPTGINNAVQKEAISIYPNPANNIVKIQNLNANTIVSVTDISGKQLIRIKTNNVTEEINVSMLPAGSYFIKVAMDNGPQQVFKLFIAR